MSRLAQFRTFSALASVLMAFVLALSLLLLSQSVSQAAPSGDTTPPTVVTVAPANNETNVAITRNVEATFSEAMNASTIKSSTFTLAKAGTSTLVAAQVTYDPATFKATLNPNADLAPGTKYTATVKGGGNGVKDLAGNRLRSDSTWSFTTAAGPTPTDTTPPDTTIDSGPSATETSTSDSASFTFSSSEPNSTFECKLDGAAYSTCTSPKAYSGLANGSHTFYVRATDAAGNVDASPASRTWTIDTTSSPPPSSDTTPPDTTIDSGPSATETSTSDSASFTFSSSEPNSTFECKLDGAAYSTCTSPKAYSGLANGSHTFYVRATDAAGNVDASPASRTWTIDTTSSPPTSTKIVALTFDDGPDPTNTRNVLDILKNNNVKATFMVVGRRVVQYPDLVRMEYAEGHRVVNHTYTHPHLTTLSDSQVRQELADTTTAIVAAGAPQPDLFRPPYGETNANVQSIGSSLGLTQVLWTLATGDAQSPAPSSQTICDRVLNGVQPGSIVLLHDGWTTNTVPALPCIITGLKNQGYSFGQVFPSSTYNSSAQGYVVVR